MKARTLPGATVGITLVGVLALAANLASVFLLAPYKLGEEGKVLDCEKSEANMKKSGVRSQASRGCQPPSPPTQHGFPHYRMNRLKSSSSAMTASLSRT